jgi:hypothetical protein
MIPKKLEAEFGGKLLMIKILILQMLALALGTRRRNDGW